MSQVAMGKVVEGPAGADQAGLGERIVRELIKSPKFKSSLRIMVNGISPERAPGLVRSLMWEDAETFMGLASAMPKVVNFLIQAAKEMAAQLNGFPTPMLVAFVSRLAGEVDFQALGEAVGEFRALLGKLEPVVESLRRDSRGALGREEE